MKIFCIGLNKTGTTSLHRALETLGFRSLHTGGPEVPRAIKQALDEGCGLLEHLGDYDAFADIWRLSERFDLLDHQYSGSKFILTTRDLDGWLDSRRRHVERNVERKARGRYQGGFLTVEVEAWSHQYHEHHGRVLEYFKDRPDDLLVMNIIGGDGYGILCPFLGVEVPSQPFPSENRGADLRLKPDRAAAGGGAARLEPTVTPVGATRLSQRAGHRERAAWVAESRRVVRAALRRSHGAARYVTRRGRGAAGRVRRRAKRWVWARHSVGRSSTSTTSGGPLRPVMTRPAAQDLDIDATLTHLEQLAARPRVTVIVAIHNAYEDLRRCLASLERNTNTRDTEILLIDDASTDLRMPALFEEWGRRDGVRILHNETNAGYTRTVNRAIGTCSGDVVLLNSDCEVTPRWLEHLVECAYRDAKTATVTAISDNAGAFSVPEIGVANHRPRHISGDEVGRVVTRTSGRIYPTTPIGNGFCMYIKRSALTEVGLFDADAFPRGYGEEGDFCMRALTGGWTNVVDDATIVFHRRSASFGAEKDELMRVGRERLDARHPDYTRLIREFVKSEALTRVQENVRAAYAESTLLPRPRPRVLYVHHRGTGGTPETNADLMGALVGSYEPYLLTSDTQMLELSHVDADGTHVLERWALPERLRPERFTDPAYRDVIADVLVRYAIDLIHIRVLLAHTFDLPSVACTLDIPIVLSFHDYYLVCPTFHLLDESNRFCGGACTPGDGECRIPSDWVRGVPHLKHAWVNVWREAVSGMLRDCDAFVTTSPTARDIYVRAYPQLADRPFRLIEHGRDLPFKPVDSAPSLRGRVRIAIPGAFDVHKGAPFIERLRELDTEGRLEFHFLGKVPEEFRRLGVMHGTYERDQLGRRLREINPAFVGVVSIWAETYSHTLSEAWAAGIPVLVTALGAPRERIEAHGGGWVLDHTDPAGAYERILQICQDEDEYQRVRSQIGTEGIRPLSAMADDYDRLYRTTFLGRRTIRRQQLTTRRLRRAALFVVNGTGENHPPTAHVRMLRRLDHPLVREEIAADVVRVESFITGQTDDADIAIVQRNAIEPDAVELFLERIAARSLPLVVDLDDDLFALEPTGTSYREYHAHLASLERLISAANLVTVSTEYLRHALESRARRVEVVPNMLDEGLWFGVAQVSPPTTTPARLSRRLGRSMRRAVESRAWRARQGCNVLYVGSRTHGEDLAMLRPVFERLRQRRDVDVRLFVVGGEPDRSMGDRWYRRVHIPAGFSHYPAFVSWLRHRSASWDIAVAPLRDTPFNRSKSDLKFLEYSALGLPGVFSDIVPYNRSVTDGETGLLVPNDGEAWHDAILRLAQDQVLRERLAGAARARVIGGRCLSHGASAYLALLLGLRPPPMMAADPSSLSPAGQAGANAVTQT